MQNTIQRVNSVRFWSWILYISTDGGENYTNLWAITNANLNVTKSIIELVLDNARSRPRVQIDEAVFSCNLYEVVLENFQSIDGIADYSTVDWVLQNVTGEALWTGWTVDEPIKLSNKQWDNTEVANLVVDADWTPLILDTDYRVFVWEDGYTYIYPLTAQAGVLDADYDYTPLASKEQIYKDIKKTLATSRFKFENTDENGKIFGIEFYEWYNRWNIDATFVPDNTTDDALNIPIEIKAYPQDATQNLFRIYDQQDV